MRYNEMSFDAVLFYRDIFHNSFLCYVKVGTGRCPQNLVCGLLLIILCKIISKAVRRRSNQMLHVQKFIRIKNCTHPRQDMCSHQVPIYFNRMRT